MYDPVLGRFVSADSVVPGSASGGLDGVALKGLTVAFHEPGFVGTLNRESAQPFWFQLSDDAKQQVGEPWGPQEAQALNRYSYVQNAPVRWTDPTGHRVSGGNHDVGYETVCTNSAGNYATCGAKTKEVRNADGTATLMRVWVTRCSKGVCRTYTKYVWSNKESFKDFRTHVDAMDAANENTLIALAAQGAITAGAIAACVTGFGCVPGGIAYIIATGTVFFWMDKAQKMKDLATENFWRIEDTEPNPPPGSPGSKK